MKGIFMEKMKNFLTSGEVAKIIGISEGTLRNWNKNGKLIPHHINPINGYKYYTEIQIQQFLTKLGIILSHSDNQQILETKNILNKQKKNLVVQKKLKKLKSFKNHKILKKKLLRKNWVDLPNQNLKNLSSNFMLIVKMPMLLF